MVGFDFELVPLFPVVDDGPFSLNALINDPKSPIQIIKKTVATSTDDLKTHSTPRKKKRSKKANAKPSDGVPGDGAGGGDSVYDFVNNGAGGSKKIKRNPSLLLMEKEITDAVRPAVQKKLKDLLCRSLLISNKDDRPTTVPFKELDDQSRHILRGKFIPKGYIPPAVTGSKTRFDFAKFPQRKKRICLTGCRYEVLPAVAVKAGFELVGENELWNISWSDSPMQQDKISQMRRIQDTYSVFWGVSAPLQKTNHFPGMYEICRKDRLGRNLNRLRKLYPHDYNFFPETWDLPTEQTDLNVFAKKKRGSTFIIKPESGCQGKGIFLLRNVKKLSSFAKCVCQLYLHQPFLIDGYKFDQRIYALITCVDPLRLYLYDEGIARFATVKYEEPTDDNLEVVFMHLTNYSLNKFSESYVRDGEGSKRKLSAIYKWMSEKGYDVSRLTRTIDDIVVKTLLCASPTLRHNYKTCFPKRDRGCSCFELLGFDILLDANLNPVLLEVNHSPSFNLDLPVDSEVKTALLKDMLNMIYLGEEFIRSEQQKLKNGKLKARIPPRSPPTPVEPFSDCIPNPLKKQFQHEMRHKGKFRLIYSSEKPGKYAKLVDDNYCGYHSQPLAGTANLYEPPPPPPEPQKKKVVTSTKSVAFEIDKDSWQQQITNSFLKIAKKNHPFLDGINYPSDPIGGVGPNKSSTGRDILTSDFVAPPKKTQGKYSRNGRRSISTNKINKFNDNSSNDSSFQFDNGDSKLKFQYDINNNKIISKK